ncbi:phosphatase PAP2 family protein [Methanobrevibacter sp. TMH8]|uniref:phosphatase PAP2 family protein n=1 Tax=Methanobrevibacter sp. TMH8 TaxID=2848611 RepID=UPI001CCC8C19|nr:phosphatase PAP2 family protein [Methanobrevibacter sp. TMH8]MBZ9570744.1 phosphatase PAP2 family protein [Methanobrevibacter sp. TMH8]
MPEITNIGSVLFLAIVCIALFIYGIIAKNRPVKYLAITGIIAIIITASIIGILKVLVNEPRPFAILDLVNLLVNENDPYSFPSGHTGNIFAIAIAFGLSWKLKIGNKYIKLIWLLIPLGILIGFSRVYIGVHYPFDVIAGAIIGIFGGLVATKIVNYYLIKRDKKFKNHDEGIFEKGV